MSEYWRQRFIDAEGQYEYPAEYHKLQDRINHIDSQYLSFIKHDCIQIHNYHDTSDFIFSRTSSMSKSIKSEYGFSDNDAFCFFVFSISSGWKRLLSPLECEKFGFNTSTGKCGSVPFIHPGGDPKYVNLKKRYKSLYNAYHQQWMDKRRALYEKMQSFPRASVRKRVYYEYLQSVEWKQKRLLILHRDGGQCFNCKSMDDLQVHHLSYQYVGDERTVDLITVCRDCHEMIHGIEDELL